MLCVFIWPNKIIKKYFNNVNIQNKKSTIYSHFMEIDKPKKLTKYVMISAQIHNNKTIITAIITGIHCAQIPIGIWNNSSLNDKFN